MVLLEFTFQYIEGGAIILFAVLIGILLFEFRRMKEKIEDRLDINNEGVRLRLQALERLTLFAERSGLQNMVSRLQSGTDSAASLHHSLVETIKTEYDYNAAQQVYVNREVWSAITRLRDQNIYIINQLAATLPPEANALDLSKRILEYSMTENAELNEIVLNALNYEAQKILD
ncbi:MAG: hypothetical protein JWQ27_2287 [Ferruginibacter sp.]|nr:hypothetical protein [Ferruginibacter sp.]